MIHMDNELEQMISQFDNGGFRIDALLKDGESERTERVYWTKSGADQARSFARSSSSIRA